MKYIFFDLDGTIVDSTNVFVESFNELTKYIPFIDNLNEEEFKKIPIEDLIKKYHIPKILIPIFLPFLRNKFLSKASKIKKFTFTDRLLQSLQKDYSLGILTTSNDKYTKIVIQNNDLIKYFKKIITNCSLLNKSKQIKKFLRDNNISENDVIVVSDEARDLKSFLKTNIKVIGVSWGFDSYSILKKTNNKYIISKPEELLKIVKKILKPNKNQVNNLKI